MITTLVLTSILASGPLAKMPDPFPPVDASARAMGKRDQAIDQLRRLLPSVNGAQAAEFYFRMGVTLFDQSRAHRVHGVDDRAQLFQAQALKIFDVLLEKHPTYARNDEALFIRAWAKASVEDHFATIKRYPKSQFTPWAYAALAAHYAPTDDDRAIEASQKARTFNARADLNSWLNLVLARAALNRGDRAAHALALKTLLEETKGTSDPALINYREIAQRELDNAAVAR